MHLENKLLISSINVCGLRRKLLYPEFTDFIQTFDIIGLQETKTDSLDQLQLDGYSLYFKHRSNSARRSGGIGVAIKDDLVDCVDLLKCDCDFVLWLKVDKVTLNIDNDLFIGIVYIPPEGSRFYKNDMFSKIEESILNMYCNSEHIMLIGDFNARTGILNDMCSLDEYILSENGFDELFPTECNPENVLDSLNLPHARVSKDHKVNNNGTKLIDLCQQLNLIICNGRLGADKPIGNTTCKDKSVIDYCIASTTCLPYIENFEILDFSALLSDVHCPIKISLHAPNRVRINTLNAQQMNTNNSEKSPL